MKKLLLSTAAAVALLAIAPTAASAGPAAGAAFTALMGTATVGGAIAKLTFGIAMAAFQRRSMKKRVGNGSSPGGIKNDSATVGETTPQSFILGRYATGGNFSAPAMSHGTSGDTEYAYLTYVIDVSDIPVQNVTGVIVNNEYVPLNGSTHPTYGVGTNGRLEGRFWAKFHDGTQTGADTYLTSKYGSYPDRPWTTGMIGRGIAYCILTFKYDREIYQSLPDVRFEVDGIKLYDPRKDDTVGGSGSHRWGDASTYEFTNNPQVMKYNILRGITFPDGEVWGVGVSGDNISLTHAFAAMNVCDEIVTNADGSTRKRYVAGYEVFVGTADAGGETPLDVIDELDKASDGDLIDAGGEFLMRAGGPGMSVMHITDLDIRTDDPKDFDPFPSMGGAINTLHATAPSPADMWETKEAPARELVDAIAEDGERLIGTVELPAVTDRPQIQQLMAAWLADARRFRRHNIPLAPWAGKLRPGDVIEWTSEHNGYVAKAFEIAEMAIDPATLGVRLSIREIDPADYNWTAATDELPEEHPTGGTVEIADEELPGFNAEAVTVTNQAGTNARPGIRITWNAGLTGIRGVTYEIEDVLTGQLVASGSTANVSGGVKIVVGPLLPSTLYRVRADMVVRRKTKWTDWFQVTTTDARLSLSDMATDVTDAIDSAQNAADAAAVIASDALTDAATVQGQLDTHLAGYSGSTLQQSLADLLNDAEAYTDTAEQSLRAAASAGGMSDGLSDPGNWISGWVYSESDRLTALNIAENTASGYDTVTHVTDPVEGGMLRFDNFYRVTSERGMRPVVPGQKWRAKIRFRYEIVPTTPRASLWIVGVKSNGDYAGYSHVQDFNTGDTSWQDFEVEFTPSGLPVHTTSGAVKWCLMLSPMNGNSPGTADGIALVSLIEAENITKVAAAQADATQALTVAASNTTAIAAAETALNARIDRNAQGVFTFEAGGSNWTHSNTGLDPARIIDGVIVDTDRGRAVQKTGYAVIAPVSVLPLIEGHTYEFEALVRCIQDSTVTGGNRERVALDISTLWNNGSSAGYVGLSSVEGYSPGKTVARVSDGWVTLKGRWTAPAGTNGKYIRPRVVQAYDSSGTYGDGIYQTAFFRYQDITNSRTIEADLETNYYTAVETDGAIATAEQTLQAEISTARAMDLPSGFGEGDKYWTSDTSGSAAPAGEPGAAGALDSKWGDYTSGNGYQVMNLSPSEINGNTVWLMQRGVFTPQPGRRYRIRVYCTLWGTITSGTPKVSLFFRAQDINRNYISGQNPGFATHALTVGGWHMYETEVLCDDANASAFWRAGFYVRGGDFTMGTATGGFSVQSVEVDDITEAVELSGEITDLKAVDVNALTGTAFGTLLQQLAVDAGGTSATLTNQGVAIANMQGNASAGYLIQAQAGDVASLLQLVAADGSGDPISVAKLQADEILLQGSVSMEMLTIGTGRNLIENADFMQDWVGISTYSSGTVGASADIELRADETNFGSKFYPTIRLRSYATVETSDGYIGADFLPVKTDGTNGTGYLVTPGAFYEFSVRLNTRRVKVAVRFYWFKADGTASDEQNVTHLETWDQDDNVNPAISGNVPPREWPKRGGIGQVPSDAIYCMPSVRIIKAYGSPTNITDCHIFQPMFAETEQNAALSPYSPGNTAFFDGGRLVAKSVDTDQLAAKAVKADNLEIFDYLEILEGGVFLFGKTDVDDTENDGIALGRNTAADSSVGFGLRAGRTKADGTTQELVITKDEGLTIKNAKFLINSGAPTVNNVTSGTAVTYDMAGAQIFSFTAVGGGGGGGGTANGSNGTSGGQTKVELLDGTTVITTWNAGGGSGGTKGQGGTNGDSGKPSAMSPYGNGGDGADSYYETTYNGQGDPIGSTYMEGGKGGNAGQIASASVDVSGLTNPKVRITIGGKGTGGSGNNATDGTGGKVSYSYNVAADVPAGPVAGKAASSGTFSYSGSSWSTLPLTSPLAGCWILGDLPVNAEFDPQDGGPVVKCGNPQGASLTVFTTARPRIRSSSGQGSGITVKYAFYPMGDL